MVDMLMRTITDTKAAPDGGRDARPEDDRLRQALAAAGTGIWQWDMATGQVRCDENFARLFDPSQGGGSLPARAFLRRIEPGDRRRLIAHARSVIQRLHPLEDDFRVRRRDGEIRWISLRGITITAPDGAVTGLTGTGQDVTDTKRSASHTEQLLREVTHRSKNMLALVLAMARLTAREAPDIDSHLKDFSLRVAGLSASQDLIVESDWENVDLGALAVAEARAIARCQADRISISGPSFLLTPEAAQTLGMIFTELTLNSMANGALADPHGHIKLAWELTPDGEITMTWRESGDREFKPMKPAGYGMSAVERFSVQGLKVSATFSAEDNGFTWTLSGPIANIGVRARPHRS